MVRTIGRGRVNSQPRDADGHGYIDFLSSQKLSVGLAVWPAGATDRQRPHREDEVYYVVSGRGQIRVAGEDRAVKPGSLVFVATGVEHQFHDIEEDLRVLVSGLRRTLRRVRLSAMQQPPPAQQPQPQQQRSPVLVTTTERPAGYEVKWALGQVFGVVVRSRGLAGNLMAGLRTIAGGEIVEYTRMVEDTRRHAIDRMVENARAMGANAVVMMRFDSSELGQTMAEVVAYGTAAIIERTGA